MRQIWKLLNESRSEIEQHPFFSWINSSQVPLSARFVFSPVMIDFIMSFADLNKWFLRYEDPQDEFQQNINTHTEEDATHSRFFVENWSHLKLGDTHNWSASKGLWWLFHAEGTAAVRRFGMDILALAASFPDPMVRFPMMEAIEICGDIFFAATAPIAKLMESQEDVEHIYYGQFHRDRETGHLQADEGCFVDAELSPEQRQNAELAARTVFTQFSKVLDELLSYSSKALADYRGLQRDTERQYLEALMPPVEERDEAPRPAPGASATRVHADQAPLLATLEARMDRLRKHPLLGWLRHAPASPVHKLQGFMPLWGIDIVGYRDFNELLLRYKAPRSRAEAAINDWTRDLATHGALYLQDWKALRLDAVLGWRMIDVISYYFLSEHTEVHRHNMAKVKKLAIRHESPQLRWWLLTALERGHDVLLEATRDTALAAEQDLGITLNYWAGRHGLVEPARRASADYPFLEQGLSTDQRQIARAMIETVFDNLDEQFTLSLEATRSGVFAVAPPSIPPPRVSQIVVSARARSEQLLVNGMR